MQISRYDGYDQIDRVEVPEPFRFQGAYFAPIENENDF